MYVQLCLVSRVCDCVYACVCYAYVNVHIEFTHQKHSIAKGTEHIHTQPHAQPHNHKNNAYTQLHAQLHTQTQTQPPKRTHLHTHRAALTGMSLGGGVAQFTFESKGAFSTDGSGTSVQSISANRVSYTATSLEELRAEVC